MVYLNTALPIEKKRRSQRKSASENKKLTVAKLGPQRAEVAANQMREESNIAAQDALSITRDERTAQGARGRGDTEHIPNPQIWKWNDRHWEHERA